jgi:type IV pilus assembly protein PilO
MNFSLSKMPWHAQLGAFAALSLAAVGVFWNFYVKPAEANIAQREVQLSMVRSDIERGLATARRLPAFRAQVSDLQAQLERLRPVLPDEKDVADLLRRLQGMATQSNLTIREFSPQPVATRQMYVEWPIGLQLDGTYHNLGAFLERVSKFPRIINVTSIHIKTRNERTVGSATISADCTATTFVLVEPGKGATPVGKPKAPATPAKPKAS